jgi:catechol 2,3-dioxygenase
MYTTRLGHVQIKVRDLERAILFYTRFLSLRLVEHYENQYAFLSSGDSHHEIALLSVGANAAQPAADGVGLGHTAFQVADKRAFALAFKSLSEADLLTQMVDNGISWALYFSDYDGNGVEIYLDTRQEPDGSPLWLGLRRALTSDKVLQALESPIA